MAYYYQLKESFIQTPVLIHNIWAEKKDRIIFSLGELLAHQKRGDKPQGVYIATIHTNLYSPPPDQTLLAKIFVLQGKIKAISPRLYSVEQAQNYLHIITHIDSVL